MAQVVMTQEQRLIHCPREEQETNLRIVQPQTIHQLGDLLIITLIQKRRQQVSNSFH